MSAPGISHQLYIVWDGGGKEFCEGSTSDCTAPHGVTIHETCCQVQSTQNKFPF